MQFNNRPRLRLDGSVPGEFYDEDYWERGAESGKGSYNTNDYADNVAACKIWATDCYNRWGPFSSFLELGCGRFWNAYGFLHLPDLGVEKLLGVDISHYAVTTAPEIVRPHLVEHDISDLDFIPDQSFDVIFSNDVMEHLTHDQARRCFYHCRRIAKKRVVHLISVGDNIDLPIGMIPGDQDQSHITMRSADWWLSMINDVFEHGWLLDSTLTQHKPYGTWTVVIRQHGRTVEFDVLRA